MFSSLAIECEKNSIYSNDPVRILQINYQYKQIRNVSQNYATERDISFRNVFQNRRKTCAFSGF